MTTANFSYTANPENWTFMTAAHNVSGIKFLRERYCMLMLEGCKHGCYPEMLRDEFDVNVL